MSNPIFNRNYSRIFLLVIVTLLTKFVLLPYSQTINGDAVSRIYGAINWMKNPVWLDHGVWGPFHFYINGLGLLIWNDQVYMPKIINIILSSLTLIPFYLFTKREFNKDGAFIATIFLAICPILFHNSFMGLSETPYLFFLALMINLLSKGLRENSNLYILLAGVAITIAAGIRYEAWVIIAVFSLLILLLRKWKFFILFNITACLFPFYWILIHWINTGNPLYGIQGTYVWVLDVMGNNDNVDFESYLRRIWYFPFSWVIAVGIPAGYLILKEIVRSYSKKSRNKRYILYSIPFIIMFLFYEYNTFKGVLLTQHRLIGTLVLLSLPFIAVYFNELSSKKIKLAGIFATLTLALSFIYNTSGVKPLPRLADQSVVTIAETIQKNLDNESCLILDFYGWDNTYFIALQSKLTQNDMVITEGAKNSPLPIKAIQDKITTYSNGFVLLKKESRLSQELNLNSFNIEVEELFQNEAVILYRWD